jgi:methyl-accepting chemotaxis protein
MNRNDELQELRQELKMMHLNMEHMARRLEQRAPDLDARRFTSEVMTAREKYLDERVRRQRAEKQLGEALARLQLLAQMVDA